MTKLISSAQWIVFWNKQPHCIEWRKKTSVAIIIMSIMSSSSPLSLSSIINDQYPKQSRMNLISSMEIWDHPSHLLPLKISLNPKSVLFVTHPPRKWWQYINYFPWKTFLCGMPRILDVTSSTAWVALFENFWRIYESNANNHDYLSPWSAYLNFKIAHTRELAFIKEARKYTTLFCWQRVMDS